MNTEKIKQDTETETDARTETAPEPTLNNEILTPGANSPGNVPNGTPPEEYAAAVVEPEEKFIKYNLNALYEAKLKQDTDTETDTDADTAPGPQFNDDVLSDTGHNSPDNVPDGITPQDYAAAAVKMVGKKQNIKSAMFEIFANNTKNKIGNVDYNKYGKLGHNFKCLNSIFVDNVLFKCLVNAENIKGKKCTETGALNSTLHNIFLTANIKARIKAVDIKPTSDKNPVHPPHINTYNNVNGILKEDGKNETSYKWQVFKVATAQADLHDILNFLNARQLSIMEHRNFYLVDIDLTQDLLGSFDKELTKSHLQEKYNFKLQGEHGDLEDGDSIIIDNDEHVGRNCLTFLRKEEHLTRWKIYNKFAQSIESASVRSNIGTHIADWINNPEERLADTIKQSIPAGLTRLEITYTGYIPELTEIQENLELLKAYIPPEIAYTTPIAEQWRAVTENLKHTLIIYDETTDVLIMGWFYNELTNRIAGVYLNNATKDKLHWIATASSLNSLPIDIIFTRFAMGKMINKNGTTSKTETITSVRHKIKSYTRTGYDKTNIFKTCTIYYSSPGHTINLADYGFINTPHINLHLDDKRRNIKSRRLGILTEIEPMEFNSINIEEHLKDSVINNVKKLKEENKQKTEDAQKLGIERQKTLYNLQKNRQGLKNKFKKADKNRRRIVDLMDGQTIDGVGFSKINARWGPSFIIYGYTKVYPEMLKAFYADPQSKKALSQIYDGLQKKPSIRIDSSDEYINASGGVMFTITKEQTKSYQGNAYALCKLEINRTLPELKDSEEEIKEIEQSINEDEARDKIKTIDNEKIKIKDCLRLDTLEISKAYTITGYTIKQARNKDRYILEIDNGKLYISNEWMHDGLEKIKNSKKGFNKSIQFILDTARTHSKTKKKENKIKFI